MEHSETKETSTSGAAAQATETLKKDMTMEHSKTKETPASGTAAAAQTSILAASAPIKSRIIGVDAARGLALLSMLTVHVFTNFNADGTPTLIYMITAGKAPALFALLAGVSLAFMTGGRHPVEGRARTAARAGLAVRALLIGCIGLALGYTGTPLYVILPYYGLLFLLAIPLIGLRPWVLACLAIVIALAVPAFTMLISNYLPDVTLVNPTFGSFLHPYTLAVELLLTGAYPVLCFMAHICAGIAIGRLTLSSPRVAVRLLGGGIVLAICAWVTSSVLLLNLGGMQQLQSAAPAGMGTTQLLWSPTFVQSWWWLAVYAPYSDTPIDLLYTMGVALAVLGAILLLTRARVATLVLGPLAAAGSMMLTIYSAHVVFMAFDPLSHYPFISYIMQIAVAVTFAVIWQRTRGRGPLETVVALAAGRARRAVATFRSTSK